ncbi:MAG: phosphoglucosamine mutase [Myxococcota bacterium]
MGELVVSYSGIRGVVGHGLNASVAQRFGTAFTRMVRERNPDGRVVIVVGRDTRESGQGLREGLLRGMRGSGFHVVELGVVPTPTVQFTLGERHAHGAVAITASHNPSQWNGFKFFLGPDNTVLDGAQTQQLMSLLPDGEEPTGEAVTCEDHHHDAVARHVQRVLEQVEVERIRHRRFRVAVDSANGAGAEPAGQLLDALGCRVSVVRSRRESEPIPENLGELRGGVRQEGCDLGFALDLDADRLALVTDEGGAPGEDYTLVLVVAHLLQRAGRADVVVVKNVSTTRALDDVVRNAGAELVETRVGEINLSRALLTQVRAGRVAFGGEGNGGVILPSVCMGRDSLTGMALVLEALAQEDRPLSVRLNALPHYHARKVKLPLVAKDALPALQDRIERAFPDGRADRIDGLRVQFRDGSWFGIRPSNTEPVVRIVLESRSAAWVEETELLLRHHWAR